jgi:hypothetical protein
LLPRKALFQVEAMTLATALQYVILSRQRCLSLPLVSTERALKALLDPNRMHHQLTRVRQYKGNTDDPM